MATPPTGFYIGAEPFLKQASQLIICYLIGTPEHLPVKIDIVGHVTSPATSSFWVKCFSRHSVADQAATLLEMWSLGFHRPAPIK